MNEISPFQLQLIPAGSSDQTDSLDLIFRLGTIMIGLHHARGLHGLTRVRPPQP